MCGADLLVAAASRLEDGRHSLRTQGVHISAQLQQLLGGLELSIGGGKVQWCTQGLLCWASGA